MLVKNIGNTLLGALLSLIAAYLLVALVCALGSSQVYAQVRLNADEAEKLVTEAPLASYPEIAKAAHADANRTFGKLAASIFGCRRFQRCRQDLEREKIYVKRSLKLTRRTVYRPRIQLRARR